MGVVRQIGKTGYIDTRVDGKRLVRAISKDKKVGQDALKAIEGSIVRGKFGLKQECKVR